MKKILLSLLLLVSFTISANDDWTQIAESDGLNASKVYARNGSFVEEQSVYAILMKFVSKDSSGTTTFTYAIVTEETCNTGIGTISYSDVHFNVESAIREDVVMGGGNVNSAVAGLICAVAELNHNQVSKETKF